MMDILKRDNGLIPSAMFTFSILIYFFTLSLIGVKLNLALLILIIIVSFLAISYCADVRMLRIPLNIAIIFICALGLSISRNNATDIELNIFYVLFVVQFIRIGIAICQKK